MYTQVNRRFGRVTVIFDAVPVDMSDSELVWKALCLTNETPDSHFGTNIRRYSESAVVTIYTD